MPTRRAYMLELSGPKAAALSVVGVASALLVGYFVWMVQPAAAREVTAACNGLKANPKNQSLGTIPRMAPEFADATAPTDMNGKPLKLANYRGKVILLHYWASWCGACEQEKPALTKMAEDMTGPDFQVVTVASDVAWAPIKQALPHGAPFQVYLDKPDEEGSIGPITSSWGTHAVPESFLIDRTGRIRMYFDNRREWDSPVAETCIQSIIDE